MPKAKLKELLIRALHRQPKGVGVRSGVVQKNVQNLDVNL